MSVLPTTAYKVRIVCRTFNHARYIKDALNGFCIQETNFPFVAIIIDDASTDGEAEIISQYLKDHFDMVHAQHDENDDAKRIAAVHKNNPNCHFLVILLKYNFCSIKKAQYPLYKGWYENVPYIAMCEGDDYWIDPQKLQKQVGLMESHSDCTLCGTNGLIVYQDGLGGPNYFNNYFQDRLLLPEDIIGKWALPTASLFYRKEITENYPEWTKKIYSGDQTLMLIALSKGNIYVIGDLTCVYRKDLKGKSISNTKNKDFLFVEKEHLKLYQFYLEYVDNEQLKDATISYIEQLKNNIEIAKKNKIFNDLSKKSKLRPFFWNFKFSYIKYKQLFRNHLIYQLSKSK